MKSIGIAVIVGLALSFSESQRVVHGKNLHRHGGCEIECLLDDYFPLCGTDGKTYANECFLFLENMCDNASASRIRKAYDGVCKLGQQGCEIPCNGLGYTLNPLCGADGKTYDNECELDGRNKCDGTAIKKAYDGECKLTAQKSNHFPVGVTLCNPLCGTSGNLHQHFASRSFKLRE